MPREMLVLRNLFSSQMLSQPHNQGILDLKTVDAYTIDFQRAERSNTDFIMALEFFFCFNAKEPPF